MGSEDGYEIPGRGSNPCSVIIFVFFGNMFEFILIRNHVLMTFSIDDFEWEYISSVVDLSKFE